MKPIPTIIELKEQIGNDLKNRLGLTDDQLRKVVDAFASVQAAQMKLLYLFLSDIQNNIFPDTADPASIGGQLERIGLIYLNRQPFPATAGLYDIEVTGESGSVLRSGLTFKSNDDSRNAGFLFVLDSKETLNGTNTFEIRALVSGLDSLLDVGDELTITEPVLGVDQTVIITEITTEPRAAETEDEFRKAVLDAIQLEPQGGSRTDYKLWAKDAQGVRDVYPYVKESDAGFVQIYVEATPEDSIDGNGTPSQALIDETEAVIIQDPDDTKPTEQRGRKPIQAFLEMLPIFLRPVDVEIVGLDDDSQEVKDRINEVLFDFLFNIRPYIAGADLARDKNDVLYNAQVQAAVSESLTAGNFFSNLIVFVDGIAIDTYTFDKGNIPQFRDVTYI